MKRTAQSLLIWAMAFCSPVLAGAAVDQAAVQATIHALAAKAGADRAGMEKGVRQVARLWQDADGDAEAFRLFCEAQYIADPVEKKAVFLKISDYMEGLSGNFNRMAVCLQWNQTLDTGPLYSVDAMFAAYSPGAHLYGDLYRNKIAFVIALNFPQLTLTEKEALGGDRLAWAYARLGDLFTERIPAEVSQQLAAVSNDGEVYIAGYNIYMGQLVDAKGKHLFPKDMVLLSHWNLRDEIKANYNKGNEGLTKQRTVYEVMKRIVAQDIPQEVINSGAPEWNPFTNTVYSEGTQVAGTPESPVRYQKLLDSFHSMQLLDTYTGKKYIDTKFGEEMEISLAETEALFDRFLSAPELKEVGKRIAKRLRRKLEAYDIWYDGFKPRSNLDESKLDTQIRGMYPNAAALEKDLGNILQKLGFPSAHAAYLSEKIAVDDARGSGHAWGAAIKGQQSRLRTRVPGQGLDYKGYNIAIHEFGHNVEQTISLYDVDYYMLNGVPNTAFTEALAFVFQKRDLDILGMTDRNPEKEVLDVLDKVWSMYEICGVSMLDIAVWKWMYAHPDATAPQLQEAVIALSKEVWNKYFASVYGVKDETVLAVYSHMIGYRLYLSAYAIGQLIEFQLEQHLQGKDFATEVDRIYSLGRLTPNVWMKEATGSSLSVDPLLDALRKVLR